MADPGFLRGVGGGLKPSGGGHRDSISLNFPENCMKPRNILPLRGGGGRAGAPYLDPLLDSEVHYHCG